MSESNDSRTGACLCGKVKFTVEGPALWNTVCYCLNCRRYTGSALYTAAICPKNGFTITDGQHFLSEYVDKMTDSGNPLTRTFCSNCGSNLFNFTPLREDIVSISAGALDDFEDWKPDLEQYCIHRADYLGDVKGIEKRYMEKIDDVGKGGEVEKTEPTEGEAEQRS